MKESKYLKANEENLKKLISIPVLREFDTKDLEELLKVSKIRQYEPKELIIKEGDQDSIIFFLISGKVRIYKNNQAIATLSGMGDLFGEMHLIKEKYRSASVYAMEDTVCLTIETSYISRISGNEKITFYYILYRSIAGIMADRLKETGENLSKARREIKKLKKIIESAS